MYRKLLLLVAMILAAGTAATAQIAVSAESPTVSQNFDSMWDAGTQEALLVVTFPASLALCSPAMKSTAIARMTAM